MLALVIRGEICYLCPQIPMYSFDTDRAAKEFVRERVDLPALEHTEALGEGMVLHTFSLELEEGKFTNVYDLSFPADHARASITSHDKLTSVFDHVNVHSAIRAAASGGFSFLADQTSAMPRQLSLNLALVDGQLRGFPVVDREAVLVNCKRLSAEYLRAIGELRINSTEVSWSGSLTDHETDTKVFANGNSIITHVQNDATGSIRMLEESSRYTPVIDIDDTTDVGFMRREDGIFVGVTSSSSGQLDIFGHDVVVRMHKRHTHGGLPEMRVQTLGNKAVDSSLQGALSVGPMLDSGNFAEHPINNDASLGGRPPFLDVPLARTVLYETDDGMVHLQLFDGRPGSSIFPGVTPNQAADFIASGERVAWGCFLDPGQTAKLVIRIGDDIASYGNTHYLKWPEQPGEKFIWVPKSGRLVASMIILR